MAKQGDERERRADVRGSPSGPRASPPVIAKLSALLLVGLVAAVLLVVRVLMPKSSGAADWVAVGAALLAIVVVTMTWAILRMRRSPSPPPGG